MRAPFTICILQNCNRLDKASGYNIAALCRFFLHKINLQAIYGNKRFVYNWNTNQHCIYSFFSHFRPFITDLNAGIENLCSSWYWYQYKALGWNLCLLHHSLTWLQNRSLPLFPISPSPLEFFSSSPRRLPRRPLFWVETPRAENF